MFGYVVVKLSDVATVKRGVRVVKNQLSQDGKYPVFQNALAPMGYYDEYNREGEETYIISAGAAGEVGYCKGKFWAADDCLVFENLNLVDNKYLYYYLINQSEFLHRNVRKASIPRLSRDVIDRINIYLPTIERQNEIIEKLDEFSRLCNDISEGLPAEIEARQKQYEYYRDKLLTFDEMDR